MALNKIVPVLFLKVPSPADPEISTKEASVWKDIYKVIPSKHKQYFIPETEGNHGSRALWSKFEDSPDYWKAVKSFLQQYK